MPDPDKKDSPDWVFVIAAALALALVVPGLIWWGEQLLKVLP